MKYTKQFILFVFVTALLQSCSIEKRLYNKGFHVEELLNKQKRNFKAESNFNNLIVSIDTLNNFCSNLKDSSLNNYDTLFFDNKFELCYVKNITKSKVYFYNSLKKYTVNSIKKSKLLKVGLYNPNNFKDENKPKTIDTIIMLNNDTILATQIKNFEFSNRISHNNSSYRFSNIFKENVKEISYADGKKISPSFNNNDSLKRKMQFLRFCHYFSLIGFFTFLVIATANATVVYHFAPLFLISILFLLFFKQTQARQSQYFYYRKNKNK